MTSWKCSCVLVLLLGSSENLSPHWWYFISLSISLFFLFIRLWRMVLPLQLQDISNMRKSFYRPQGKVKKNQIRISLVWLHGAGGFCSRKYCSLLAWWASKGLWESFGRISNYRYRSSVSEKWNCSFIWFILN